MAGLTRMALIAVLLLSACGQKDPRLMNLRSATRGPDEFGILPTKPLQAPESYTELPEPTPGARSLAEPVPEADAIAALGGNPAFVDRTDLPAGNASLLNHARRYGVESGIRTTLADEDLNWRRKRDGRLLERIFKVNVYFKAYKPMSLDQHAELARWRAAGVRTVGAPPNPEAR